jgi:hypothetical protein
MLHTQSQNMGLSMILMGLAVLLFGLIMLIKPGWFKAFSVASLKPHGGLGEKAEATWETWHKRSAVFCVLIGLGMMIGGGVRLVKSGDPFDVHATPVQALASFSMGCAADEIELVNAHAGPIWIRLSYPSVFGVTQQRGVPQEILPDGWLFSEAIPESHSVVLRGSEVISLAFGERVKLPLFGVSSADCGGGLSSLPLSAQGRELRLENLQVAAAHCDRFQVQVALYDDPEKQPAFVGWRACALEHGVK